MKPAKTFLLTVNINVMKKNFYFLLFTSVIICLSESVYSQWIPVNSGTNVDLLTMSRSQNGFILCGGWDGVVLMSEDHGKTWAKNILTDEKIFHVDAYNDLCFAISDNGELFKSTDAGNSWQLSHYFGICTRGLSILSPDQVLVAGQFETLFETNNEGQTWFQVPNIVGANVWLRDIAFADKQNGFIVGDGGRAYKTPNFGYGWFLMNTGVTTNLSSVSFPSSDTGFICGLDGTLLKTIDGGITWNSCYNGQTDFRNVYFLSTSEGYVSASDGILLHTSDGGNTWEQEAIHTTEILKEFCYIPSIPRLLLCGTNGTIFYKNLSLENPSQIKQDIVSCRILVFPNPTNKIITFNVTGLESKSGVLTITTSDKKTVAVIENVSNGDLNINLSDYPAGVFFYSFSIGDLLVKTGKFIKE